MSLEGKVAVVTGGGQGLGRADALLLAKAGATIAILDLNEVKACKVAEEIVAAGGRAKAFRVDVASYDNVQQVFSEVRSTLGLVGILVNNAAKMDTIAPLPETTREMWDKDLSVNLGGPFNCSKAVWADMVEQKYGRIVNMTSIAGVMGGFGQVAYGSAKAGVIGLTKSLALEGARHNIRVNVVAPSLAQTPASDLIDPKYHERMIKRIPMRRVAEPEELARVVVFLASDDASFITGQLIQVNGGADLFTF